MSVDDSAHRGDVPPPIDLAGHMRELGRALLPALIVAVLVGAAVFVLRSSFTDKEYSASIVTQVEPAGEVVAGDAFVEQLRAPFIGLAEDTDVLRQVVSEVDTDWDAATLGSHVELTPGTAPALLTFTVTAPSPELALQFTQSMVSTVSQAARANNARDTRDQVEQLQASVAAEEARNAALGADDAGRAASNDRLSQLRDQLSQLQTQGGDQLVVLATPEQSTAPVAPKPASEASVAALAALVVAAEAIVLLRSRIGSRPSRAWARRVARKYRATFDADISSGLPPVVASRTAASAREGGVRSSGSRHAARSRESVVVLSSEGADVVVPGAPVTNGHPSPALRAALTDEWWNSVDPRDVDTAVVVVSRSGSDRAAAERALKRLRDFGVPTHLVLHDVKRRKREPATSPPPTPTPAPQTTLSPRPLTADTVHRPAHSRPIDTRAWSDVLHPPDSETEVNDHARR